jgi:hypothetical protein
VGGNFHTAGGKASANIALWSEPRPATLARFVVSTMGNAAVLEWTNPDDPDYRETLIRVSTIDYPMGPRGGAAVPNGNAGRFPGEAGAEESFAYPLDSTGGMHHFAAYAVDDDGRCSAALYSPIVHVPDRIPPSLDLAIRHPPDEPELIVVSVKGSEPLDPTALRLRVGAASVVPSCVDDEQTEWEGRHTLAASAESLVVQVCATDLSGNESCVSTDLAVSRIHADRGGAISSTDGRLHLAVPPRALEVARPVTVIACADTAGGHRCYRIGPGGLAVPGASLALSYDADDLEGLTPDRLVIVRDDETSFQGYVDDDQRTVSTEIDCLGVFRLSLGAAGSSILLDTGFLALDAACPNPFAETAHLRFELRSHQRVDVTVYDVAGRRITRLLNAQCAPGFREVVWEGRTDGGRAVPSGVYFCTISTARKTLTTRLLRLR